MRNLLLSAAVVSLVANSQEHTDKKQNTAQSSSSSSFDWANLSLAQKKSFLTTEVKGIEACITEICGDPSIVTASTEKLVNRDVDFEELLKKHRPKFFEYYKASQNNESRAADEYKELLTKYDENPSDTVRLLGNYFYFMKSEWIEFKKFEMKNDGELIIEVDEAKLLEKLPKDLPGRELLPKAIAEVWTHPLIKDYFWMTMIPYELAFKKKRPGQNVVEYFKNQKGALESEREAVTAKLGKRFTDLIFDLKEFELSGDVEADDLESLELSLAFTKLFVEMIKHPEAFPASLAWKGLTKDFLSRADVQRSVEIRANSIAAAQLNDVLNVQTKDVAEILRIRAEAYRATGKTYVVAKDVDKESDSKMAPNFQTLAHLMNLEEALEAAPSSEKIKNAEKLANEWQSQALSAFSKRISNETARSAFSSKPIVVPPKSFEKLQKQFEKYMLDEVESAKEENWPDEDSKRRLGFLGLAQISSESQESYDWDLEELRRKFRANGLEDAYFRIDAGAVRLSANVVADPKFGEGVFKHEIGHSLSHSLQNAKKSAHSQDKLKKASSCMQQKHGPFFNKGTVVTNADPLTYHEGCAYHEEDFADYVAGISTPAGGANFGCMLIDQYSNRYEPGSLYKEQDDDTHSPDLYRLLQTEWQINGKIPDSCKKVLDENKIHMQFEDCMPLDK